MPLYRATTFTCTCPILLEEKFTHFSSPYSPPRTRLKNERAVKQRNTIVKVVQMTRWISKSFFRL